MGSPMKIRTKLEGDVLHVRVLISHPMETGLRRDADDNLVPAHFIELVTFTYGPRVVLTAQWGPAVSRNPYLSFKIHNAAPGGRLKISWTDNRGDSRTDETIVE